MAGGTEPQIDNFDTVVSIEETRVSSELIADSSCCIFYTILIYTILIYTILT